MDTTTEVDDDLDVVEYEEFVLPDEFERSMGISFKFVKLFKNGLLRKVWGRKYIIKKEERSNIYGGNILIEGKNKW